jgi:2-polyprenyl-3-methyl-5-hydroxy-6-metoxy-1,4-benzoquinol methylase/ribosomal protein S27E
MSDIPNTTLRETEIRPQELMAGQAERFAADLRRLLEHRTEFVTVPCPACEADDPEPAFEKHSFHYVRCRGCETVYVSPRPTPAQLDEYYRTSENYAYWNRYIFPASEAARRVKIFQPRAERVTALCRRYGVARGTLLEIGSGFGTFCEEMRRLGDFRRIVAVEPTPDLAATCRQRGLEVVEARLEDAQLDSVKPDVIASFEVLEHSYRPRTFVERCATLLDAGGMLVLTCPNVKGFDVAILGPLSDTFDPEHLNYFHPRSLSDLLTSCGFDVLETLTPGRLDAELVRNRALSGQIDLARQPFLRRILVEEWDRLGPPFQDFLAAQGLSSHMWIVARRRATAT